VREERKKRGRQKGEERERRERQEKREEREERERIVRDQLSPSLDGCLLGDPVFKRGCCST